MPTVKTSCGLETSRHNVELRYMHSVGPKWTCLAGRAAPGGRRVGGPAEGLHRPPGNLPGLRSSAAAAVLL
eukprot:5157441-Pyramimonas_sp.AAC.1